MGAFPDPENMADLQRMADRVREAEAERDRVAQRAKAEQNAHNFWVRRYDEVRARADELEELVATTVRIKDHWVAKSKEGNRRLVQRRNEAEARATAAEAERDSWEDRVAELEGELAAYKRDLQVELDGAGELRDRYGARENEGFGEFVGRLAARATAAEADRNRLDSQLVEQRALLIRVEKAEARVECCCAVDDQREDCAQHGKSATVLVEERDSVCVQVGELLEGRDRVAQRVVELEAQVKAEQNAHDFQVRCYNEEMVRANAAEAELTIERACSLANAAELRKADDIIGELRERAASRAPAEPGPYRQCVDCGAEVDEGEPHECAQPEPAVPEPDSIWDALYKCEMVSARGGQTFYAVDSVISAVTQWLATVPQAQPEPAVPDSASLACRQDCDAPFLRNGRWCVSMATRHERGCLAECLEYLATTPIPAVVLDDIPRAEVVEMVRRVLAIDEYDWAMLDGAIDSGGYDIDEFVSAATSAVGALTPALRRLSEEGS